MYYIGEWTNRSLSCEAGFLILFLEKGEVNRIRKVVRETEIRSSILNFSENFNSMEELSLSRACNIYIYIALHVQRRRRGSRKTLEIRVRSSIRI